MTEIIDLSLIKNDGDLDFLCLDASQNNFQYKTRNLHEQFIWSPYQKRDWKHNTVYYFQLENIFTKKILINCKRKVKISGKLTLMDNSLNLSFSLLDQYKNYIKCKSNYHKILLSKQEEIQNRFSLQINSNLEYFRLKVNSYTGEITFNFELIVQSLYLIAIEQIVQFALDCYQQQIFGHIFTLQLLQFINPYENLYIARINQNLQLIKQVISHKSKEFQKKQPFSVIFEKTKYIKGQNSKQNQNDSTQNSLEGSIKDSEDFYSCYQGQSKNKVSDLKKFLLQNEQEICQSLKSIDIKPKFSAQIKRFYQKDKIYSINLIRKAKMNNIINIEIKKNNIIQECIQNLKHQGQSKVTKRLLLKAKPVTLQQKSTGKTIRVQMIQMSAAIAFQQYYICENLTKFQSLRFMNQYVKLSNYAMLENGFVLVYYVPSKLTLRALLQANKTSLSLISKSAIAYHIVVIVYTLQQKNKIANYFPQLSIDNIQVSSNYSLNLKRLSNVCKKKIPPLMDLLQILHYLFFQKRIKNQQEPFNQNELPFSSDQVFSLFQGPSSYIRLIKFYILHFSYIWKKQTHKQRDHSQNVQIKKSAKQHKLQFLNSKFMQICEDLMIIFGYLSEFLGRQNANQSNQALQKGQGNSKQSGEA